MGETKSEFRWEIFESLLDQAICQIVSLAPRDNMDAQVIYFGLIVRLILLYNDGDALDALLTLFVSVWIVDDLTEFLDG